MATAEGICIVIVNEDLLCSSLVAEMLQSCTYEVLMNAERPLEALSIIRAKKDSIKVVITNLHRVEGFWASNLLQCIKDTLNLPTSFMSPDDDDGNKVELEDYTFGAYLLKSFNKNVDIANLLRSASVRDEMEVMKAIGCLSQLPFSPRQLTFASEGMIVLTDGGNQIVNSKIINVSLSANHTTSMEITPTVSTNQITSEVITAPLSINKEITLPPAANQFNTWEITASSTQVKHTTITRASSSTPPPGNNITIHKPHGRPPAKFITSKKISVPFPDNQTEITAPPPCSQTTTREITVPSSSNQNPTITNDEGKAKVSTKQRKEKARRISGGDGDDRQYVEKKPRVIWSEELHHKFLTAMDSILPTYKVVPKKICEYMNVPGLTRENVASHLQKYRLFMHKLQKAREATAANNEGSNPENHQAGEQHGRTSQLTYFPYHRYGMSQFLHCPLGLNSAAGSCSNSSSSSTRPKSWNARLPGDQPSWRNSDFATGNNVGSSVPLYNPNRTLLNQSQGSENSNFSRFLVPMRSGHSLTFDPMMRRPVGTYIGFRLSDDGKSIEFGHPDVLHRIGIRNWLPSPKEKKSESVKNQSTDYHTDPSKSAATVEVHSSATPVQLDDDANHIPDQPGSPLLMSMSPFATSHQNSMPMDHFANMESHYASSQNPNLIENEEELHLGLPSELGNHILPPLQQSFAPQYEIRNPFSWEMSVQITQLPTPGVQQSDLLQFDPPIYGDSIQVHTIPTSNILDCQAQTPMPLLSRDHDMVGYHSALLLSAFPHEQQENMVNSVASSGHNASFQELLAPALPSAELHNMVTFAGTSSFQGLLASELPFAEQETMVTFSRNSGHNASVQKAHTSALPFAEQETMVNFGGYPRDGASIQEIFGSGNSGQGGSVQGQRVIYQESAVPSAPVEPHRSWMDENYPFLNEMGSPPRLDDAFFDQNR